MSSYRVGIIIKYMNQAIPSHYTLSFIETLKKSSIRMHKTIRKLYRLLKYKKAIKWVEHAIYYNTEYSQQITMLSQNDKENYYGMQFAALNYEHNPLFNYINN